MSQFKYRVRNDVLPTLAPLSTAIGLGLSAGSLQAATITVDSLADGVFDKDLCTLRAAVYSINYGMPIGGCMAGDGIEDTVTFASQLSGNIQLNYADTVYNDGTSILIGASMTIEGPGADRIAVVGAGHLFTGPVLFAITEDSTVTISGLTIRNGFTYGLGTGTGDGKGGGILSHARHLTLEDMVIQNNVSAYGGGGVWHETDTTYPYPTLTIRNSEFIDNNSYFGPGGGVGFQHPGYGELDVHDSLFDANRTWYDRGGGLWADIPYLSFKLNMVNNEFIGNSAAEGGGGVYLTTGYVPLWLSGNDFIDNSVTDGNGGGLSLNESGGGGVGYRQLRSNLFQDNVASANGGGAHIELDAGVDGTFGKTLSLLNNQFRSNQSDGDGGGMMVITGNHVDTRLENDAFTDNQSASYGGGLRLNTNSAYAYMTNVTFSGNDAQASGGGMSGFMTDTVLIIDGLTASGNSASFYGGGVDLLLFGNSSASLGSALISSNQAGSGGGLVVEGSHTSFGINDSSLVGNQASNRGGGLFHRGGASDVMTLAVTRTEISDNQASVEGGGLWISQSADSVFTLHNSTVSGNSSGNNAGGIRLHSDASVSNNLKYSTIAFNHANGTGGGVFSNGSSCAAENSIISSNTATTGPDIGGPEACSLNHSLISNIADASLVDDGDNLFDVDANLEPLAFHGGTSRTHRIDAYSPAFNAGNAPFPPPNDQRGPGFDRVRHGVLDMGAYELQMLPDFLFEDRFQHQPQP